LAGWRKKHIREFMSSPKSTPEKTATCPECGGTDIVKSIGISKMTEAGPIGLGHHTEYFVKATEPLVVDLCRNCGTVVRLYVKKADKRWTTV
jgi:transcription elongation factor Elf1